MAEHLKSGLTEERPDPLQQETVQEYSSGQDDGKMFSVQRSALVQSHITESEHEMTGDFVCRTAGIEFLYSGPHQWGFNKSPESVLLIKNTRPGGTAFQVIRAGCLPVWQGF